MHRHACEYTYAFSRKRSYTSAKRKSNVYCDGMVAVKREVKE